MAGISALALASAMAPGTVLAAGAGEALLGERFVGKADAPVTIIEYASLGCPHCASFHFETYPELKKKYIDTGKVRLIFRDFPLGPRATAAHMLARCGGERKYFGLVDILFRDQAKWAQGDRALEELTASVRKAGLSSQDVQTCLSDEALLQGIQKNRDAASREHNVQATPTFIIAGTKVEGAQPFSVFEKIIKEALN